MSKVVSFCDSKAKKEDLLIHRIMKQPLMSKNQYLFLLLQAFVSVTNTQSHHLKGDKSACFEDSLEGAASDSTVSPFQDSSLDQKVHLGYNTG